MTKTVATAICLFSFLSAFEQDSTKHSPISWSVYVDAYAAHYSDSLGPGYYQKFPSVSPRSHQMGLNVAMLTVKYAAAKARATVTLHYGDIPSSAWSARYNVIQEANVGLLLCKNLWLDGGF